MKTFTVDLRDLTNQERGELIAAGYPFSDTPDTADYEASRFQVEDDRVDDFEARLARYGEHRAVVTAIDGAPLESEPPGADPVADADGPPPFEDDASEGDTGDSGDRDQEPSDPESGQEAPPGEPESADSEDSDLGEGAGQDSASSDAGPEGDADASGGEAESSQ